jgi:hypothetical protein
MSLSNGKQEKFIRPEVFQTALLDEIAERLYRIEQLQAKPKGNIYPINITVTEATIINFIKRYPYTPMFAVTLFNDGPDEVYPGINIPQKETPLQAGENLSLEFHTPKIEKLILVVKAQKTAKVRGFAIY